MTRYAESDTRPEPEGGTTEQEHGTGTESSDPPGDGFEDRTLRRSREDRVIAGVCGGLGRHLDVDPVLFRIAFMVSLFAGGIGLLFYIILWIAVPEYQSRDAEARARGGQPVNLGKTRIYLGGLFLLAGGLILLHELFAWFDTGVIASLALIGIGAVILVRGMRRG